MKKHRFGKVIALLLVAALLLGSFGLTGHNIVFAAEDNAEVVEQVTEEAVDQAEEEIVVDEPAVEESAPAEESSDDAAVEAEEDSSASDEAATETVTEDGDADAVQGADDAAEATDEAATDVAADDASDAAADTAVTEAPVLRATDEAADAEDWIVTFLDRDNEIVETRNVTKGEAIGTLPSTTAIEREDYTAYWAVGTSTESGQGTVWTPGERIGASYVPEADVTIVPDYDKITHTISFYKNEDDTTPYATKTVDVDTSYCLNDIPDVPAKDGHVGKWVYSEGDFNNTVEAKTDLKVWAEYDQNEFTVTFKVGDSVYQTDTYYSGDTLTLPGDPVAEGKKFQGWFAGETEYTGGEAITSDLTLTAKFDTMHTVSFLVYDDNGEVIDSLSQFFEKTEGQTIDIMPQKPFVSGKVFEKWVLASDLETEVTADTVVNGDITAVAKFRELEVNTITVEYYYLADNDHEVVFDTQIINVDSEDLPYTITAPSSTQTDPNHVAEGPVYYPETPTVEVTEAQFTNHECTVRVKYVKYTAEYSFVYMLKDITGDGYTEIERENVQGVLGSYVTPPVKVYNYATVESAEGATITQAEGQEIPVKYTRKEFSLSYETNGGSYVEGVTALYGSDVTLSTETPIREGYTFDGWYLDDGLTEAAGASVTIEGNTTVYAKWAPKTVNYTIVYMFEKYNDAGTESSFVYDNSETASAKTGETVHANDSSVPEKTRKGWEKDTGKNAESSVQIAADGSSVLYVYYKLKEYTFNFNAGTYTVGWSSSYNVTATLTGKNVTGTGNLDYTMTVKLGQDISSAWPANATGTYTTGGYYGQTSNVGFIGWKPQGSQTVYVTKRTIVTDDMLPQSGDSITYTAQWSNNTYEVTVNYWLQNADNNQYTKSTVYSQTATTTGRNFSAKDIPGYTYNSSKDDHKWTGGWGSYIYEYNFYYDRDKYKIDYMYGSENLKTINNIKFDANINTSTYNWTPTPPEGKEDYTWGGWCSDSGLTTAYNFSTMPATNLVLYAKWVAPSFTVSFDLAEGTPEIPDQIVEKNHRAEKPEGNPTKEGYTFEGWYTEATGGNLYDWTKQITEDTTIYAHWSQDPISYTVRYVDGDGQELASEKTVTSYSLKEGEEVTENAIAIAGYRPDKGSKTLELSLDKTQNVITFVYGKKSGSTSYTVKYLIEGTEIPVAEEKHVPAEGETLSDNVLSVIEMAAAVDYETLYADHPEYDGEEFYPDEVEKELVLGADENENVITFYYSKFKCTKVTVNYVDMDGNAIPGQSADHKTLKVGETFTLSRTPIQGWEMNKAVVGTDYDGTEAGSSYRITEDGGMVFTIFYKKKATITVKSLSKTYNGEALYLPASLTGQVKVEGITIDDLDSLELEYANTDTEDEKGRLNAGVATVTPNNATFKGKSQNYYAVRYIPGTLTVNKVNVTIRVEPDRWTGNIYDGTVKKTGFTNASKSVEDYIIISHDGYKEKYLSTIWETITGKDNVKYDESAPGLHYYCVAEMDAGDYPYTISLTKEELPQNSNYSVNLFVRDGRLQILPKPATITTGSASKEYDGTALTNAEASITGLVEGETATVTATGTQTEVGTSNNAYSIGWGDTKSSNYTITENLGTLEVTDNKKEVTLTAPSDSKTYDGTALTADGTGEKKVTAAGLPEGFTVEATATGSQTDAGESANVVNDGYVIKDSTGADKTANFTNVKKVDGMLKVDPAPVTITTGSDTKEYDGTALTNAEATITGLVNGETATVTATGSQIVAGSSDNTYSIEWGTAKETNYTITESLGKLTVAKAPVTITTGSGTKEYDGTALTNAEATITGLVNGETATVTATGSQTEVGSSDNTYSIDWGTTNKDNYTIKEELGKLEVTENSVTVTLTAASDSKTYDGTALTNAEVTAAGLPEGFTVEATATGSQTDAGESANVVNDGYVIKDSTGADKTAYFTNVKKVDGTLKVDPAPVTVTTGSANKAYDGTALTKDEASITGLVNNETATVTATGTQTEVGSSDNTYSIDWGTTNKDNYTIKENLGKLEVTENSVTVTLTAASDSKTYDGKALENAEVTASGLPDGFTVEATASGSQTDAGSSENVVNDGYVIKNAAGEDKTANFTGVTKVNGTLTVNPKAVTITTGSDSKAYDGTPLTKDEANIDGLVEGESVTLAATGTITEVGSTSNTYSITWDKAKESNYTVNENLGTLTITENSADVVLTAASDSKTYDSTALTNAEVTASGLPEGFTFEATASGSQTDAGESANKVNDGYKFFDKDGNDKTANFTNVEKVDGTLTVNPKAVTITTGSDSKAYDGTPLTNAEANIEGLVNDETATVKATGSQTEVGSSTNTYSIDWGETNKDNYTVTETLGTLTITENSAEVTLTAASDSKTYDGSALTNAEVTAAGLPEGFTVEATASGSQTDAGESANVVNDGYLIKDASGADKTANFTKVTKVDGTLTVNKAPVTIMTGSASKAYDGTALTKDEASINGLVNDETATVKATGSQTEIGSSDNTYSIEWGTTKATNYTITEELGKLEVTENNAEVTLTAATDKKAYDGTALTNATVTAEGLPEGFTVEATASGSQTDAGESANKVDDGYVIKDASGNDKTANFTNVTKVDGKLTVEPKEVTITTGSDSKEYDGTALTKDEASITGLVNDETAAVTATGSQTEVGSSSNTYSIEWGTAKAGNYTIKEELGTLTITENSAQVTLIAQSETKTYDGTALTNSTVTASGLPEGFTFEAAASGSQTDVGSSANKVNDGYVIKDASGKDKTKNFTNIVKTDGILTVEAAPVTITTGSDSKEYDGTALTNAAASIDGLVNGETATVTATGSQTEVGSSSNTYSIKWGTAKADNYTITEKLGTLEVTTTAAEVTLTAATDSKTYDGKALTNAEVTASGLPEGFTFEAAASGSQTDAGESANVVNDGYKFFDKDGNDKTANFTKVTKVDGTLTVNPKAVAITTGSDSKAYDGTALTNAEATIEGLVEGESVTLAATGTITEVGSTDNTYSITWDKAKESNYTVTENLGTLTITTSDAEVVLTAASDSKTYDGKALTNATVTAAGLPEGFTFEATASGSQTDAGESANVVNDGYKFFDKDGNDKTANFTKVEKVDGKLTVNPKAVTITTGSDSKAYDGTALTNAEATIEGLVEGESVALAATGTITEVGSTENTYSITWDKAKAGNYTVTDNLGTLTITENSAEVTLTAVSDSKTYDGKALTNGKVTASGLPEGFTFEATASGSQTDAGESANVVNNGYKFFDKDGNDKTANFTNVKKVDGKLTVNKAAVTITTGSGSKEYDGTALTNAEVSADGFVEGESVTLKTTGTITEVGSTENTYSIDWDNAKAGNYTITDELGTLTITKNAAEVILTAATDSKTYDGTALTNTKVTASGLPEGFTYEATANGSQTDAGESANVVNDGYVIKDAAGEDKTANFTNVKKVDGKLTVDPKAATITTGSGSKEYDGAALTNAEATIEGLVEGESVTLMATGTITEVGSTDNTYSITWDKAKESNYTVTETLGTLTITENSAEVTLTAASANKTYDGKALRDGTVTAAGLPEGFTVEASASGSQTDAGESANAVNDGYVIKNAAGEDKTAYFTNVKKVDGKLTVEPKAVTITAQNKEFAYDGTEKSWPEYDVEGLVGEDAIEAVITGSIKFPSQSPIVNKVDSYKFTEGKAGNYAVTTVNGELTMTNAKAEITITAASQGWIYDGQPHENTVVTVTDGKLFTGDKLVATATGKITNAEDTATGNNPIAEGYKIMHGDEDVTANYAITPVAGTLTVSPKAVTITAKSEEFTYDGEAHSNAGYDVDGLVGDDAIEAVVTGNITFPTQSPVVNELTSYKFTTGTAGNYTVTTENGKLTMKKASVKITITAASQEWTYDGQPHENKEVTVTKGKLLTGDTLVAEATGKVQNVEDTKEGNNPIAEGYKIMHGDVDVSDNYVITPVAGTLTITAAEIIIPDDPQPEESRFTVTGPEDRPYDGTDTKQKVTIHDNETGSDLVEGQDYTIEYKGDLKNVGTVKVTIAGAGNYSGKVKREYKITPVALTLKSATLSKVYDGTILENGDTALETEEGWIKGEGATYQFDASVLLPNEKADNTFKIKVNEGTSLDNYTLDKSEGTLSIKPRSDEDEDPTNDTYKVTFDVNNGTFTYDGKPHTVSGYQQDLVYTNDQGVTFDVSGISASRTETEAGEYAVENQGTAKVTDPKRNNVTDQFTVTVNNGSLTIKPAKIIDPEDPDADSDRFTVSTPKDVMYNGTEQKQPITIVDKETGKELSADDITISYSDDVTNAGTVTITITGNGNYTGTITKTYKITPRTVILTSASGKKTYDGKPLTRRKVTVSGDGFVKGEGAICSFTGSQTEVGGTKGNNLFTYKLNEGTLAGNYDITTIFGTLTVTEAPVIPVIPEPTPEPKPTPTPTPTPTPSPSPITTTTTTTTTRGGTPSGRTAVVPGPAPVIIDETPTPQAEPVEEPVEIEEDETPIALPPMTAHWALINLLAAIATAVTCVFLLIRFIGRRKEDQEEAEAAESTGTDEGEEEARRIRRKGILRLASIVPALAAIIVFILTEDMSAKMQLADRFTILMIIILIVQIAVAALAKVKKDDEEDDEGNATA